MFHLQIYTFTHWLHLHPHYAGMAAFVIAFLESIVIVGTIIPGSITMTAIGILIGSGVVPIWYTLCWAIAGAFIGDGCSYLFGYYFKYNIHQLWPFSRYPKLLSTGEDFFLKHGGKSILIGRFFGPVRAITPTIAGMFNMQPKRYFTISFLTAVIWAPSYLLPGVLIGAASLEMPPALAAELTVGVLLFLIGVWIVGWLSQKIYEKTHAFFAEILDAKWQVWETQKSKKWFCYLLRHAERPNKRGQLLMAIIGFISFVALIFVSYCVKHQTLFVGWNNLTYHFFRGFRTPSLHKMMLFITYLGDVKVLFPVIFILIVYLALEKRIRTALHFIIATLSCGFIIGLLHHLFYSARPAGVILAKTSSSFPSGHVTFSTITFGFIAFLFAKSVSNSFYRKIAYWTVIIISISVAISRLYLCQHWLTDVIGAYFLVFFVFSITIISYRRHIHQPFNFTRFFILFVIFIVLLLAVVIHKNFQRDFENSTLYWPTKTELMNTWWSKQSTLVPYYRNNRANYPLEILNIEWAGDLTKIKKTLYAHGWKDLHRRDYVTTLKQVAQEQKDLQKHFTLFAPLFDDQKPLIEMIMRSSDGSPLLLRLWPSNIILMPQNMPLYVGTIYYDIMQKHRALLFFKKKNNAPLNPSSTAALTYSVAENSWQYLFEEPLQLPHSLMKKYPNAHIILIRPL